MHRATPGGFKKSSEGGRRFGSRSVTSTPSSKRRGVSTPVPSQGRRGRSTSPHSVEVSEAVQQHHQQEQPQFFTAQQKQAVIDQIPSLTGGVQQAHSGAMPEGFAPAEGPESTPITPPSSAVPHRFQKGFAAGGGGVAEGQPDVTPLGQLLPVDAQAQQQGRVLQPAGGGVGDPFKFSGTLQNIYTLRRQIDELQDAHKREELSLIHSMKHMIESSQVEKHQLADVIGSTESQLKKEKQEKDQAVQLYHQFKFQGDGIIQRLSNSLTDLQKKYAEDGNRCVFLQKEVIRLQQELRTEHQLRVGMENQIAQYQLASTSMPGMAQDGSPPAGATEAPAANGEAGHSLPAHAARLQELVREKDASIVILENKLATALQAASAGGGTLPRGPPPQGLPSPADMLHPTQDDVARLQAEAAHWKEKYEQLEQAQRAASASAGGSSATEVLLRNELEMWKAKSQKIEHALGGKMEEYQKLIVQQDAKIQVMQSAGGAPDQQAQTIARLQEKIDALESGAEQHADYEAARNIMAGLMSESRPVPGDKHHATLMENAVVKMLVEQLKAEKRQRLETEEQSDRMMVETNKQIAALEQRMRNTDRRDSERPMRGPRGMPHHHSQSPFFPAPSQTPHTVSRSSSPGEATEASAPLSQRSSVHPQGPTPVAHLVQQGDLRPAGSPVHPPPVQQHVGHRQHHAGVPAAGGGGSGFSAFTAAPLSAAPEQGYGGDSLEGAHHHHHHQHQHHHRIRSSSSSGALGGVKEGTLPQHFTATPQAASPAGGDGMPSYADVGGGVPAGVPAVAASPAPQPRREGLGVGRGGGGGAGAVEGDGVAPGPAQHARPSTPTPATAAPVSHLRGGVPGVAGVASRKAAAAARSETRHPEGAPHQDDEDEDEDEEEEEDSGIRNALLKWEQMRQRHPQQARAGRSGARAAAAAAATTTTSSSSAAETREASATPSSHYTPSAPTASPTLSHASHPQAPRGTAAGGDTTGSRRGSAWAGDGGGGGGGGVEAGGGGGGSGVLGRLKRHLEDSARPAPTAAGGAPEAAAAAGGAAGFAPAGGSREGKPVAEGGGGGGGGPNNRTASSSASPTKACSDSLCELERLLEELSGEMRSPERGGRGSSK